MKRIFPTRLRGGAAMTRDDQELTGDYQVQRSKIINHPEYGRPVLFIEYGWAKRGKETVWVDAEIKEITE